MSFATVAIVGGTVGAGVLGGIMSGNATRDAANTQAQAARDAAGLQYQMFEQQRADQAPWRAAGAQALSQMGDPSFQRTFTSNDMMQDPGYQFRMQQGQKALEASAAARGGALGGNMLQALSQYGQDYGANEYQNAYSRFTNDQSNRFNRLASLAGLGQTANNAVGGAAQNYANNAGQAMMGGANAQAAAGVANANMWGGILNNSASTIGNTWMQQQMMNRYAPQPQQYTPQATAPAPSGGGGGYGGGFGLGYGGNYGLTE